MTQPPDSLPPAPASSGAPVDPATAVSGPGMALMIVGVIYCVGGVFFILRMLLGMGLGAVLGAGGFNMALSGVSGVFVILFTFIFGGVMVYGGMKMRQLQNYNLAMIASVVGMLPCTCCCIAGLPVGIWALVILMKPEVKAAFK